MSSIAPPAPSVDAGSPDVSSSVDSSFESFLDGSFGGDTPADETPAAEEPQDGAAEDAAQPADTQPEAQAEDNIFDDEDELEPERVDQDGRNAYKMSEARMQRFQSAKKFYEAVQEYAPTVEAAKANFQAASDFNNFLSDIRSGDPSEVSKAIEYLGNESPEGLGVMATQMLPYLGNLAASNNPHAARALQAIEGKVSQVMVSRAYNQAAKTGNPEDLYKAQSLEFALTGKFREAQQLPKSDPNADLRRELEQRQKQLDQRDQQAVQQRWNELDTKSISGGEGDAMKQQLDRIFSAPQIKNAAYTPKALEMIRESIESKAKQQLANDHEWSRNRQIELREIQREFKQAHQTGAKTNLEPRIKAYVDDYAARLNRVIPGIARAAFSATTKAVVDQNKATHAKLQAGAQRIAPGGSGRPAPRSVVPTGKTNFNEFIDSVFE